MWEARSSSVNRRRREIFSTGAAFQGPKVTYRADILLVARQTDPLDCTHSSGDLNVLP
jgi:hypothetical protein